MTAARLHKFSEDSSCPQGEPWRAALASSDDQRALQSCGLRKIQCDPEAASWPRAITSWPNAGAAQHRRDSSPLHASPSTSNGFVFLPITMGRGSAGLQDCGGEVATSTLACTSSGPRTITCRPEL